MSARRPWLLFGGCRALDGEEGEALINSWILKSAGTPGVTGFGLRPAASSVSFGADVVVGIDEESDGGGRSCAGVNAGAGG